MATDLKDRSKCQRARDGEGPLKRGHGFDPSSAPYGLASVAAADNLRRPPQAELAIGCLDQAWSLNVRPGTGPRCNQCRLLQPSG